MKTKQILLYSFLISVIEFIRNTPIYVGNDGAQDEGSGTLQSPFQNITYALNQINNSSSDVEIILLENVNGNYLSGNFSFRDTNISIK